MVGKMIVYTPKQSTNLEKYFINYNIEVKMPTLAENKHFFYPSSVIGRAFSFLRQKMDEVNPSQMEIKVFVPAPTYCLQFEKRYSP